MLTDRQIEILLGKAAVLAGFDSNVPMDFARAVEREARREALEEAAKICEGRFYVGDDCAAAIRAMIEEPRT